MQKIIIIIVLLVTTSITAQSNYEKGMQKAFQYWGAGNSADAISLFERIAKAEPDNWLPAYYAAQINITNSFGERDITKLTNQLKKAQELVDAANSISKNNAEIMILQALIHTVWVTYDGAAYGPKLAGRIVEIYTRASIIAPENPRVSLNKAEWDLGSVAFSGGDTAPICKQLEKTIELFATFEAETPFHPNWGAERAKQVAANCGK